MFFSYRDDDYSYEISKTMNSIPQHSVLKKVKLLKNQSKYVLTKAQELLIQKYLEKETSGSDDDEDEAEEESPIPKETKRKRKKIDEETTIIKKKKTNAGKAVASKADKGKKEKKEKTSKEIKAKKEKKVKVKKPPVDKSDPNWRLKPNPIVQVWEKDPLFEAKSGFNILFKF
jgi:hypothetical protein